jgi:hypothetical protein
VGRECGPPAHRLSVVLPPPAVAGSSLTKDEALTSSIMQSEGDLPDDMVEMLVRVLLNLVMEDNTVGRPVIIASPSYHLMLCHAHRVLTADASWFFLIPRMLPRGPCSFSSETFRRGRR